MTTTDTLSPEEIEALQQLRTDFAFFSKSALRVRVKSGAVEPLRLNRAQLHLDQRLEAQKAKSGRVRAIIVKGRQLGCSTFIQARFYHRLWRSGRSLRAFILTHEQPATDNLFGMAQRFYENHPVALGKPPLLRGNAKELRFGHNDCGYQVSTAGTKETGRSATFQLFHGSECGFWPNAEDHATGAFQTIGEAQGTEVILESTANGVGNFFYRTAQAALRGQSEFEAIFIPWFWGDDYQRVDVPSEGDWNPSAQWLAYAQAHGLTWEQLYWAFLKNRELANSISASADEPCWKFMQEYPATFDEAFQSSGNSFIPATSVLKARKAKDVIGSGPIILGIDPARSGDKVGIIDRCGRRMGERICMRMDPGGSVTYVAAQVEAIINRIRPDMVNIDVGSNGAGVYDILMDHGHRNVNAVNFGSNPVGRGPTGDDSFFNRRAEMWDGLRAWFEQDLPVRIPDDDGLQGDLTSAQWGPGATRYNTSNELVLEEKAAIKARLGASPDLGDACALTFAVPFAFGMQSANTGGRQRKPRGKTGY